MQPPGVLVTVGVAEVLAVVGLADVVEVTSVVLDELMLVLGVGLELEELELLPPPLAGPVILVSTCGSADTYEYLLPGPDTEVVMLPLSIYTPDQK